MLLSAPELLRGFRAGRLGRNQSRFSQAEA